jgi:VCBS repeat-containing protein
LVVLLGLSAPLRAQLFSDNFTRGTDPGPLAPWLVSQSTNWVVTGGVLRGGTNVPQSYGYAYITNTWINYSVQARLQFAVGVFGGGIGGRLNTNNGAHYAAWIYPEGSPGGSNILKLVKFQTWTTYGYTNSSYIPMHQVNLEVVSTNFHTLKLLFQTNLITVFYDSNQVMSVTDVEPLPYLSGGISADMWTDTIGYTMAVDDVLVTEVAPIANNDSYSAVSGFALNIPAPGILTNDIAGSNNVTAILASGPAHGSFSLNANGSFSYTATNNFTGSDSFIYRATDGISNSPIATVTLTVGPNHPPITTNDSYVTPSNTTLTVSAPGVLANDTDIDGTSLTAVLVTGPANGSLSFSTNGGFTYTPTSGFTGTNTFTYRATDGVSTSSIATATISVLAVVPLFSDDFTRGADPGPLSPWIAQSGTWTVTGGTLKAGTNIAMSYGFAYITNTWTNYSGQARLQFPSNAFGGGVGLCLNPFTGAHYGAWVYPEGSAGGSNLFKIVKFQNWSAFGYNGSNGVPMQQVSLASVGTNWHTVKLAFQTNQLTAFFDGIQLLTKIDTEAQPYPSGVVSVDMWTDTNGYSMFFDDVQVEKLGDDQIAARPPALQIQSITLDNNTATVTWSAAVGRTYRMQYKDALTNGNWTDVVPGIVATNSIATATNGVAAVNRRFYRVALLP